MEKATLTIQRKLMPGIHYDDYRKLFRHYKKNNNNNLSQEEIENITGKQGFGLVRFIENKNGVYFEHIQKNNESKIENQLSFEMEIPAEWLICFSYQEMEVIGLDMGVFQAQTMVKHAMDRLRWIDIDFNHPLYRKSMELYIWLKNNARLEDHIRVCSDWIYYHPNGKYDYFYVRKEINRKIKELKQFVDCPHWTNRPIVS